LKVLILAFKEDEGFCFFFWRSKVLIFALAFIEIEGFCFYAWRLKVFDFTLKEILKEVEGFCSSRD
jgi:hypothetical protein